VSVRSVSVGRRTAGSIQTVADYDNAIPKEFQEDSEIAHDRRMRKPLLPDDEVIYVTFPGPFSESPPYMWIKEVPWAKFRKAAGKPVRVHKSKKHLREFWVYKRKLFVTWDLGLMPEEVQSLLDAQVSGG